MKCPVWRGVIISGVHLHSKVSLIQRFLALFQRCPFTVSSCTTYQLSWLTKLGCLINSFPAEFNTSIMLMGIYIGLFILGVNIKYMLFLFYMGT